MSRLRVARHRLLAGLRRRVFGHPGYFWLLWAAAAALLASCPMMLSDPAIWPSLLDPELLALLVIVGAQFLRLEAGVLRLRVRARLRTPLRPGRRVARGLPA